VHDLLRLWPRPRLLDAPYVQRSVLPVETTHTTHVVSVIGELLSRKAVFGAVWQSIVGIGECVQEVTFPAIRTTATTEEQTAVFIPRRVCPR